MSGIKVPAEHIAAVAKVINRLRENGMVAQGVAIEDLHVLINDGVLELRDSTGTFGSRHWASSGAEHMENQQ